jgi:hypothetical protein
MKEDKLKEAIKTLGNDVVDKIFTLSEQAAQVFVKTAEDFVEEIKKDKKANERIPTQKEITDSFERFGFEVPKGAEFYKISEFATKRGHACYGMKVGAYVHSCHIDTTDFIVLLIVDGLDNWTDSFGVDTWAKKLFTV